MDRDILSRIKRAIIHLQELDSLLDDLTSLAKTNGPFRRAAFPTLHHSVEFILDNLKKYLES